MEQLLLNFLTPSALDLSQGLNSEQAEALNAPINTALQVLAGAGTGKTELITRRFITLAAALLQDGHPNVTERIWVSTFTEKAAYEMRTRIAQWAEPVLHAPLSTQAWIGTFHSLCLRILQADGDAIGWTAERTILSDVELLLFQEDLVGRLVLDGDALLVDTVNRVNDSVGLNLKKLTTESLLALEMTDYASLFSEIVLRVIPRIKAAGWSPAQFYQIAQAQTQAYTQRLKTMPGYRPSMDPVAEQHAYYARTWSHHLAPVAQNGFSFLPDEWMREAKAVQAEAKGKPPLDELGWIKDQLKPFYKAQYFLDYDGKKRKMPFAPATQNLYVLQTVNKTEQTLIELVTAVYLLYQESLAQEMACDYDDLILQTIALLEDNPDVAQRYQKQFKHIMVDEFQDSNGAQLRLLQALLGQDEPRLTAVGDKKQSIYGFRFAEPQNLGLVFKAYPNAKTVALQTNYRSLPPVLAMANRITQMMNEPESAILHPPVLTLPSDSNASLSWLYLDGDMPVGDAQFWEVRWIAESIAQLLDSNAFEPQSIAVLVRSHGKAMQVETALNNLGIPAIRQRDLGFFESPVIRQAVAWLELMANPNNDMALIGLLQLKLNHRQLFVLAQVRKQLKKNQDDGSYFQACCSLLEADNAVPDVLQAALPAFRFLKTTLDAAQLQQSRWRPDYCFDWILRTVPLMSPQERTSREGRQTIRRLLRLKQMLGFWSERPRRTLTLEEVLVRVRRAQARNELEGIPLEPEKWGEAAVRIMTVHAAKGLEFPVVFLAGVEAYRANRADGIMTFDPQYAGKAGVGLMLNKTADEKSIKRLVYETVWKIPQTTAEELRLFYVAVTRAKTRLFVSSCSKSFIYMQPALYEDLDVQTLGIEEVSWQSQAQCDRWLAEFTKRYDVVLATPVES